MLKDWDLTWNTDNPIFTPCFERTVLAYLTPIFLWIFAPLDIYFSYISVPGKKIPWSALSIAKLSLTGCLMGIEMGFFVRSFLSEIVYPVDIWSPIVQAATLSLYIGLLISSKRNGVGSSGIQFLFWAILTFTQGIRFRTLLLGLESADTDLIVFLAKVVYLPLVVGQFILHCWADIAPIHENEYDSKAKKKTNPECSASFLSKLLFEWVTPLTWTGFRKPLEYSDLYHLNWSETCQHNSAIFDSNWPNDLNPDSTSNQEEKKHLKKEGGVFLALSKTFGWTYILAFLIRTVTNILFFASPQILNLLIDFISSPKEPQWKGILYATILFLCAFIGTLFHANGLHIFCLLGLRIRSTLISAVYRKALLLSNTAKRSESQGEIMNHIGVDINYISEFCQISNQLWSAPLIVFLALYFLWGILGPSCLAGLLVVVILLPINATIASKSQKLQKQQMRWKDKRTKLMNEILSGIKVLKLYAWEPSFENQVLKIRNEELRMLKTMAYLNSVSDFLLDMLRVSDGALAPLRTYIWPLMHAIRSWTPRRPLLSLPTHNIIKNHNDTLPTQNLLPTGSLYDRYISCAFVRLRSCVRCLLSNGAV
ncbi:Multidrug resistance-associated protein 1 [Orchesella cincta]|uniref:Multidrug resistance-associated protein 1 n=1 Tax=Orchesella cincta TaxID=48709 RepID=A0A1D2MP55_ORCCI|nr:Multidrug resistance-associated protein 1 [Orchesella cincta]